MRHPRHAGRKELAVTLCEAASSKANDPLSVDERSALYLLGLARDLVRARHPAVACMLDYAMLDIARGDAD